MAKETIDLMISRTMDGLEYNVCQMARDKSAAKGTRIEFIKGSEPDSPLLGSIIALCAAAGEEPFDTAIELAEYLYDDAVETDNVKEYIHEHIDEMREAIGKMGKHEKKDDEPKEKTVSYEELMDYIKQIFG